MENDIGAGLLQGIIASLLLIIPIWKIHAKAGLNPTLSLLVFIPYFGLLIVALVLAFSRWPSTEGEA